MREYLALYKLGMEQDGECYYDWGDDPSFFAAEEFLGDVNRASWGVCRRDVREKLSGETWLSSSVPRRGMIGYGNTTI